MRAGFLMFDYNNSNTLDLDELTEYLSTVFRMFFVNNKKTFEEIKSDDKEVAESTAHKCFTDCLIEPNGEIHIDEFMEWVLIGKKRLGITKSELISKHKPIPKKQVILNEKEEKKKQLDSLMNNKEMIKTLEELKETTNLGKIFVLDAVNFFKEKNKTGFINRVDFKENMLCLLKKFALDVDLNRTHFDDVIMKIFNLFDMNKNGIVNIDEVALACSVLCKGSVGDKAKILFDYYDLNGDKLISFTELVNYFKCFFQLSIKSSNKNFDLFDLDTLSQETAKNCFASLKIDVIKGQIDLSQFRKWCDK